MNKADEGKKYVQTIKYHRCLWKWCSNVNSCCRCSKKKLESAGIPAKISKCTLGELEGKQQNFDLVLTTANYKKTLTVPHMSVFGLISGVNVDLVKNKLLQLCQEIISKA